MPPPQLTNICLWDFSLHQYARPGVSRLCINLQDEHGVNVNLLLWALWLGYCGKTLDTRLLAQAQRKIHSWDQHYVVPLRQLRRRMKVEFGAENTAVEAVRARIKQAELLAEKYVLSLLESLPLSEANIHAHPVLPTIASSLMEANLHCYLESLSVNEDCSRQLLSLLDY